MVDEWGYNPDLVKVEAEGAEPEVLAGTVDLDCEIVVDVSDERVGESTRTMCEGLLNSHGYATEFCAAESVLYAEP
ncbi:hypothetical protein [Halomicrobium urmianum]|uniref:hypothetical protein n=1 Tax=Halomicrobium urmianum TaxID=1586233 RepID=UPI001CD98453|nr:hypothetical protein [Halomicrobium urmianum]